MHRYYVPEDHVVVAGALLTLREAARYLRPGAYEVAEARAGSGPVGPALLLVGRGGARLRARGEA